MIDAVDSIVSGSINLERRVVNPHLAVIDLSEGSENIVRLGDKLIIDARDKMGVPGYPHGYTDRDELEKYNQVINAVRTICQTTIYYYEQDVLRQRAHRQEPRQLDVKKFQHQMMLAAVEALRALGFSHVQRVKIKGKIPTWWTESNGITAGFILGKDSWQEWQADLDALDMSISLEKNPPAQNHP